MSAPAHGLPLDVFAYYTVRLYDGVTASTRTCLLLLAEYVYTRHETDKCCALFSITMRISLLLTLRAVCVLTFPAAIVRTTHAQVKKLSMYIV